MDSPTPKDEAPPPQSQDPERPAETSRRDFIGSAAAMAAAVVGAPALLAACDAAPGTAPEAAAGETRSVPRPLNATYAGSKEPWWTLHHKIAATIGSASNVKVPALERTTSGYVQRIVTDDDRTGTGLATVLRSSYKFDTVAVAVVVQSSTGKRWPARSVLKQADLAYAMRDALATNTLSDGVLKESFNAGTPVVALIKASVVQFFDSAVSDFYGNYLDVASRTMCDIFNPSVGGYAVCATTRDFRRC